MGRIMIEVGRLVKVGLIILLAIVLNFRVTGQVPEQSGVEEEDFFNIIFHQSFDETTPGLYNRSEWERDWNNAQYTNGLDKTEIIEVDHDKVMKFNYPKGVIGPSEGGGQWLSNFGSGHEEVYFSFNMMLKPGFEWQLGGKLPGLGGGNNLAGGRELTYDAGFSVRIMFSRDNGPDGNMYFYVYHQDKDTTRTYGDVFGFGSENLLDVSDSTWYNLTMRVTLNSVDHDKLVSDPGNAGNNDGLMEFFFDGQLVYSKGGMRFRNLETIWLDTQHITSFFGGSTSDWAPTRTEWSLFDDFYVYTYKEGLNVPRGRTRSEPGREIIVPKMKKVNEISPDIVPPSAPKGIELEEISSSSIFFSWEPSTDNITVAGYRLFLNDTFIDTSFNNSHAIQGLLENETYELSISAFDKSGNESELSNGVEFTTLSLSIPDTIAPTVPTNLRAIDVSTNSIEISWTESFDSVGVESYCIFLDTVMIDSIGVTSYLIQELEPDTEYKIYICAFDSSLNGSPHSDTIVEHTSAPLQVFPNPPQGLEIILETLNSISIAWDMPIDSAIIEGYYVNLDEVRTDTVNANSVTIKGLDPGNEYEISVIAFDTLDQESLSSEILKARTKDLEEVESPAMPDVSIIKVDNESNKTTTIASINSFGYSELKDFGVLVTSDSSTMAEFDTIIYAEPGRSLVRNSGRVERNLELLYNFSKGLGDSIQDISGSENPINLSINDPLSVYWLPGRGLKTIGNVVISGNSPTGMLDALIASNECTFEAWIKPSSIYQSGPASIFSISASDDTKIVSMDQLAGGDSYDLSIYLNTSESGLYGDPLIGTSENYVDMNLQHLVYTRDKDGVEKLFIDGIELYSGFRYGELSTWGLDSKITLANETLGDKPWEGTYYLFAVYSKALSNKEVIKNFSAGLGEIEFFSDLQLESNVPYSITPFARTMEGNVVGPTENLKIESIFESLGYIGSDTLMMRVYPNPANEFFQVEFEDIGKKGSSALIRIVDQTGQI